MLEKQGRDESLREKYGLHEEVDLGEEDIEDGKARWEAGRERRGLPVEENDSGESSTAGTMGTPVSLRNGIGRSTEGPTPSLAAVLRKTTKRKYDPFADVADAFLSSPVSSSGMPKVRGKIKDPERIVSTPARLLAKEKPASVGLGVAGGLLAGYGSD